MNAFIEGGDLVYHITTMSAWPSAPNRAYGAGAKSRGTHVARRNRAIIKGFAQKAKEGKISVDDLSGGTFTISNGGVYGSLMSTPILNPPQSGILGMHKIEERPVAVDGQVVIRPMMYVAFSYDHRIVDGAECVSFLVQSKTALKIHLVYYLKSEGLFKRYPGYI